MSGPVLVGVWVGVPLLVTTVCLWRLGERSAELDDREKALDDRAAHLAARAGEHAHTKIEVEWVRAKLATAADRERWLQDELCRLHDELLLARAAAGPTEFEASLIELTESAAPIGVRVRAAHLVEHGRALAGEGLLEAAGMPSSPVPHPRTVENVEGPVG